MNDVERCPECGGKLISEENEVRCESCGLVVDEEMIDSGPDWRAFSFDDEKEKSHVGLPSSVTKHDKGLSTEIGFKDRYGKELAPEKKAQFSRLRRHQLQSRRSSGKERSLSTGLQEMHRMVSQLNISKDVHEVAAVFYKTASGKGLMKGRSIEAMVAATLYIASRFYNLPRTLEELSEAARVSKKEVARAERYLADELDINLKPASPVDYVPRFVSELDLGKEVENRVVEVIGLADEKGLLSGRSPVSIAAAATYLVAKVMGKKVTQREISDVSGVSEVTIRNRYHEIEEELDL
ncbi:TFIIB-type zinc ribbon-containing protein [Methanonatronarchaeum sp. AMET-Sl]|uniref:transcription initiation factor IIB n=1 Tax=Methanonatronarchaeum sp. AMET-Sl TaxID=3037654 RepID=UPI00244DD63E|nr:TFIIB-type zinc ribbon-containing protein [Methanonatronarchaeum sp. AMET-Sl]WGI17530.1 TFIIB-type zinc ribbon-containing protein [Methanonatronarchaeum sp. AMET-Sl]